MKPTFITLEGVEGAGKTTVLEAIAAWAAQRGIDLLQTREPGGCPSSERLRELLLDPALCWCSEAELLLMFAARWQHWSETIEPALKRGQWVVSDRFVDASFAYQCGGRGLAWERVQALADQLPKMARPGLTLLLDLPVELGLERARKRGPEDRFEQEKAAFFERVRQAYLQLAEAEPERVVIVDATQNQSQVAEQVTKMLEARYQ
ncbi:MAG: thymidylate kinase [Lysobacteraceae bacterium]|nr:MAG: thymidylate kinase [Xanthomonadaceae bacterium]